MNATEDAVQRQRAKQKAIESAQRDAAIGNVNEMQKLVHELISMKKKDDDKEVTKGSTRFADNCISLLDRCTRVGAVNLHENQELGPAEPCSGETSEPLQQDSEHRLVPMVSITCLAVTLHCMYGSGYT